MPKDSKEHVSVVVIGHVDSGKSTTTGHLIYKCGGIDKRTIEKYEKEAKEQGKGTFKYAWVMDISKAERERGITIQQTAIKLELSHRDITVIDSPGHKDFIKNMITGTSACDYALLMIPASRGEFETSISKTDGTAHEHCTLAYTMGIRVIVVLVNKMDAVDYDQARYNEVTLQMKGFLQKVGFNPKSIAFIPISGWHGDNMVEKSTNMAWYTGWSYEAKVPGQTEAVKVSGETLVDYLDRLPAIGRPTNKPFRLPISDIYKIGGVGTVVVGRVESGVCKPGEVICVAPVNVVAEAKSIEMHHQGLSEAIPGDNVGICLKNVSTSDVRRGNVVGHSSKDPPRQAESFTAQVVSVGNLGKNSALHVGYTPVMDCHTFHVPAKIMAIKAKIDKRSGKPLPDPEDGQQLAIKQGEAGIIECQTTQPVCVEVFSEIQALARFAFRDMKRTIAVGIIQSVVKIEPQAKGGAKGGAPGAKKAAPAKGKK